MVADIKPRRRLLSVTDALEYTKCGKTTLYELIGAGAIVAVHMRGKTLIDADSVDRYHKSLPRIPLKKKVG